MPSGNIFHDCPRFVVVYSVDHEHFKSFLGIIGPDDEIEASGDPSRLIAAGHYHGYAD